MSTVEFGSLRDVSLREAWPHEAHNFTPWLVKNIDGLSKAVGIPLEVIDSEVAVETFSADILAKNAHDDSNVLIENQLESSDHLHLGQIMTYLAGLDARTVVWVASDFREPHISAVDWLNEWTDEAMSFFAVKIRVVRIGESPYAPIFDVVARPNNWERRLHAKTNQAEGMSERGQRWGRYWKALTDRVPSEIDRSGPPNSRSSRWRPLPDLDLVVAMFFSREGVGVFVRGRRGAGPEEVLAILEPRLDDLRAALGVSAENDNLTEGHFLGSWNVGDPEDPGQRDAMIDWQIQTADRYETTLRQFLGSND